MKKMGIDFGTKRVGVALSDENASLAFPKKVLSNVPGLVEGLVSLIEEEKVDIVVVGWSTNQFGDDNAIMGAARRLAEQVESRSGAKTVFQDESFSSVEAERFLNYAKPTTRTSRQKKVKKELDDSAAAIILQRYLDTHR